MSRGAAGALLLGGLLAMLLSGLLSGCDGARGSAQPAAERDAVELSHVVLSARNAAGVPLHPAERSRELSGRVADGARVEVLRWGEERRWLEVRTHDGTRGWITARYLSSGSAIAPDASPWASAQACAAATRLPREPGRVRIASWNLRWFPDGSSGGPSETPTDVDWVACVLAALRVDAVSLQEILLHPSGLRAVERLKTRLGELSGGRWEARFDECPRDGRQHVGWLYDAERAQLLGVQQIDSLNPLGRAGGTGGGCAHRLRPGLALDLRFVGGLDLALVALHLDSGVERHDYVHRRESVDALGAVARALRAGRGDDDVLVLGDFNTMGCRSCEGAGSGGAVSAGDELAALDRAIERGGTSLRRVPSDVPCTEYYRGRGGVLDHVLASRGLAELASDAQVEVAGECARRDCRLPRGVHPPALAHLSDHCPLVVELEDRDRD